MTRAADWNWEGGRDRSFPARLIQPAFMDLGASLLPEGRYDNTMDDVQAEGVSLGPGLKGIEVARLQSQVQGQRFENRRVNPQRLEAVWQEVLETLAQGRGPLSGALAWNSGQGKFGHVILIEAVQDGRVHFVNPWGQRESLSEAEFKAHLTVVQIPARAL